MSIAYKSLFVLTLLGAVVACAPAPHQAALRYLLPPPPNDPKIEWLNTYASEDDFPKTASQRRMELIVGKPPMEELIGPSGIASDGEGKVFVGDIYTKNIFVFDLKALTVSLFFDGNSSIEPRQMTFDSSKRLYVVDSKRMMVLVYSREGKQLRTYGNSKTLQKPVGVAVDEVRKRVYISDGPSHDIKVFDQENGALIMTIGKGPGEKEGELYNPTGLALAADGSLYVVEVLNARVSIFNPDGTFKKFFGVRDDTIHGFESPRGAAVDSEGNLWVIDFRRGGLRAFSAEGKLLLVMEGPMEHRMGFSAPSAIHIDANDEVFVTDFVARRFSHWRYLSKSALARHPITAEDLERVRKEVSPEKK